MTSMFADNSNEDIETLSSIVEAERILDELRNQVNAKTFGQTSANKLKDIVEQLQDLETDHG